jgi:hypothetical protein
MGEAVVGTGNFLHAYCAAACMLNELQRRGRQKYIDLNKRFLAEVEKGATWEALQPLINEMKLLAVYLQQIPGITEVLVPEPGNKKQPSDTAADLEEPIL